MAHQPSATDMTTGKANLPKNANIAGQYLIQGDGGFAGYNMPAAGDHEPLLDNKNSSDPLAQRLPAGRASNAHQTKSERYSRKDPLVDKKSQRQHVGNFYELTSNQRQQPKKRIADPQFLEGPYTDNVEIKNGSLTQKGLSNTQDLIEDYSNFEATNQVAFVPSGQPELGGTQKIGHLNRYLVDEQTMSSRAGVAYANTGMMGNTTSS